MENSSEYWLQEAYLQAYQFAAIAHQGQRYPGTELPYVMHLSFVSMEVLWALQFESELDGRLAIQCALLHDVIEDTEIGFEHIEAAFGQAVATGVLALSKDPKIAKDLQMADCLERIQQQPREVWIVKLADRISNLQTPPSYWTSEKIDRYREEAKIIHQALGPASCYLAERLQYKIVAYPQ